MQSLRYKVGASYFVLVLIGLATSIFAVYSFTSLRESVEPVLQESHRSTVAAENLVRTLGRQEIAQLNALIHDWELNRVYYNDARDEFLRWLERAQERIQSPDQHAIVDSILQLYRSYLQSSDSLFVLLSMQGTEPASPLRTLRGQRMRDIAVRYQKYMVRPIVDRLKNQCFSLMEATQEAMVRTEEIVRETTWNATVAVLLASLGAIILSFAASIQFTRTIIHPAERLTDSVRKIAQGQLNQKIDVTTDDEIGELSVEFNKMTERLREFEELNIHQLIAEKKKSETIVENIIDPIIVTDGEDRLVLINQAAASLLELRGRDWSGRALRDVFKDQRWITMLESDEIARSERERRDTLLPMARGGATLYFRPRHARIVDERGTLQGRAILLQDVTRFKDLDKMKSEFVATVSHELRTPLTSLNMGVDILSKEVLGSVNERQKELLVAAKDDLDRLGKLVKDLLDLSKLESGRVEMKKESISVRSLLDETIRPLRLPFEEKRITLKIDVPKGLPSLLGDSHQLSWVVANLLSNALRFTDPGGSVLLRVSQEDGALVFTVQDTGCGIPEGEQSNIFEKFVQVKGATETTPGSVGLGLAIAREVVEAHGGRIWVQSAVGVGSTFTFVLPLRQG